MFGHYPRSALLLGTLALLWPSTSRGVDLEDDIFQNRQLGVRLEVPDGWTLHRQTGFPALMLLLSRKESSATISVASAELPAKTSMKHFLADNATGLRAIGLRLVSSKQATLEGRPAWLVKAQTQDGAVALQQINLPQADRVFILTLSCPKQELEQLGFELNRLLELLELSGPQKQQSRTLRPIPPGTLPSPGGEASPQPTLESGPLPSEPGAPPLRPGAEGDAERPGARPGIDSRPSGDAGRTVDSRPNRPRAPQTRPTSQPATAPAPIQDLPMIEGQEL